MREPKLRGLALPLESWDGLRLGLLALGYQKVLWLHLHCASHGVYRLGLPEEQEQYFCPVCLQACKVSVLAEGFTKQALPFAPELIDAPLPRWWVARIGADLEGERVHRARTPRRYIRRPVAASYIFWGVWLTTKASTSKRKHRGCIRTFAQKLGRVI